MRRATWLLLLLSIVAVAVAWWWQPAWFRQTLSQLDQTTGGESTLYRWTDPSGKVQISDTPPDGDTRFEVLNYRHDVNVIPEPDPR